VLEAARRAELTEHLGYEAYNPMGRSSGILVTEQTLYEKDLWSLRALYSQPRMC
jgi:hypothetical protein